MSTMYALLVDAVVALICYMLVAFCRIVDTYMYNIFRSSVFDVPHIQIPIIDH